MSAGRIGPPWESLVRLLVEITPRDPGGLAHLHSVVLDGRVYLGGELISVRIRDIIGMNIEQVYNLGTGPLSPPVDSPVGVKLRPLGESDTAWYQNGYTPQRGSHVNLVRSSPDLVVA